MNDTNVVQALLAKLTDLYSTVAAADALQKAQRVGGAIVETKIRLRVLKMMRARGVEIANEHEIIAWVKTHERKFDVAQEHIIAQQVEGRGREVGRDSRRRESDAQSQKKDRTCATPGERRVCRMPENAGEARSARINEVRRMWKDAQCTKP